MGIHIHHDTLSGSEQTAVTSYAAQVARVTEDAAKQLYYIDNFFASGTVKFKQWYDEASRFLRSRWPNSLMPAIYGYAVEEYVNLSIASGNPSVPAGYRVRLQVTHGGTRPDIVILNSSNTEIAWLDITSQSSKGHINKKAGNWQNGRSFIAELLYPDFKASNIITGSGSSIADYIRAYSITRRAALHENALMSHLTEKMNDVFSEFAERIRRGATIYQPDVAECVERKFGVTFTSNYKHPIIKSMLQLYINCSDAIRKSDARNCLSGLYGSTGQDKAAAVSYIEESKSTLEPYIYY